MKITRALSLLAVLTLSLFAPACPPLVEDPRDCRCRQVGGKTVCNSACDPGLPKKVR